LDTKDGESVRQVAKNIYFYNQNDSVIN